MRPPQPETCDKFVSHVARRCRGGPSRLGRNSTDPSRLDPRAFVEALACPSKPVANLPRVETRGDAAVRRPRPPTPDGGEQDLDNPDLVFQRDALVANARFELVLRSLSEGF
ncbi:uncharacterized protein PGTG_01035 [Puccinia graminis f. sp. tritici CRL 75-36-700-3]|uniref:Uncharacterized protein n=1 Tax=Puccinia graminis f. sp. tritici (strain CRL 75-36-700-3 / race SCCL) TaxID=418459 RepID=E3JUH9_PUCGT|nr:uncharacterized protein PGTG_01035 [Puccinia graminis f. sp. tritici CRL 75-36-700-3]EFP75704.1 hypothetical protein PGTG_01035 [Puccinia graminis f. sp. tritici CRL 75-36-700-3]